MDNVRFGCERARHRSVEANGLRLHFLEWGSSGSPGLCFLHGGSAHAHWFDAVAPAFADRFHVVSLDQRGHGESAWPAVPAYATEDFAGDLERVLDALGWKDAVIAGHSMGGHNAMAFAAWRPARVRALVVVDSRPALPADRLHVMHARGHRPTRRHASVADGIASFRLLPRDTVADRALLAHIAEVGLAERDGGWVFRFDPQCNGARRPVDAWPLVGRITAPTLIVRAELSPVLPRDIAERLHAAIPRSRLVEIPGAYHHVTLDRPPLVAAALDDFFQELGPSSRDEGQPAPIASGNASSAESSDSGAA
jgi:pimeloyl-ACP methyl ester carboxylesterase